MSPNTVQVSRAAAPDAPKRRRVVIPALLTEKLIRRHYLPIGSRTLARWISSGKFPKADVSYGAKLRFWKRSTVRAWMRDLIARGEL